MNRPLPPIAVILGLLGLLPFLACGFGVVGLRDPVRQLHALAALLSYGAVILSFLGAVHWGLLLADDVRLNATLRLTLGVLPAIVGWAALLAGSDGLLAVALVLLAAGFAGVIALEQRGSVNGLVPPPYLALRWVLSVVVLVVLLGVLVLRLAGLHIAAVG